MERRSRREENFIGFKGLTGSIKFNERAKAAPSASGCPSTASATACARGTKGGQLAILALGVRVAAHGPGGAQGGHAHRGRQAAVGCAASELCPAPSKAQRARALLVQRQKVVGRGFHGQGAAGHGDAALGARHAFFFDDGAHTGQQVLRVGVGSEAQVQLGPGMGATMLDTTPPCTTPTLAVTPVAGSVSACRASVLRARASMALAPPRG